MNSFLKEFDMKIRNKGFKGININSGGCGRAAVLFYKFFRKRKDVKVLGIKMLSKSSLNQSPNTIRNTSFNLPSYFYHLVLSISHKNKTYFVDAVHGILPQEDYLRKASYTHLRIHPGYLSYKKLIKYNKEPSNWNQTFKVRTIRKLKNFLKDYNEETHIHNRALSTIS